MAEKWERSFEDICRDAGIIYSPALPWRTLFRLVEVKWKDIAELDDDKLGLLGQTMDEDILNSRIMYLYDPIVCAFCLKAAHDSGSTDYKLSGGACDYCILEGKCFDEGWLLRRIYIAMKNNSYAIFRNLIRQGLRYIELLLD